jgi:hypothetical protein
MRSTLTTDVLAFDGAEVFPGHVVAQDQAKNTSAYTKSPSWWLQNNHTLLKSLRRRTERQVGAKDWFPDRTKEWTDCQFFVVRYMRAPPPRFVLKNLGWPQFAPLPCSGLNHSTFDNDPERRKAAGFHRLISLASS